MIAVAPAGASLATARPGGRSGPIQRLHPGSRTLRKPQHAEFDRFADRPRGYLAEAEKNAELRAGVDTALAAHQLLVLIDGLSAERVLYPAGSPRTASSRCSTGCWAACGRDPAGAPVAGECE
jgi:hypothetical protein